MSFLCLFADRFYSRPFESNRLFLLPYLFSFFLFLSSFVCVCQLFLIFVIYIIYIVNYLYYILFHLHLLIKLLFIFFCKNYERMKNQERDINLLKTKLFFFICVFVTIQKKHSFTFLMYWESCYLNTSQINKYILLHFILSINKFNWIIFIVYWEIN